MGPGDDGPTAGLRVVVAHGTPQGDVLRMALVLAAGARVGDALATACAAVPGWPVAVGDPPCPRGWTVAVWGRRCDPARPLRDGDRVELLRPLTVDPKESRRLRYRRTGGRQGGIERGRLRPDAGADPAP